MDPEDFRVFRDAYVEALCWSESEIGEGGEDLGNYEGEEGSFSAEAARSISNDCEGFLGYVRETSPDAYEEILDNVGAAGIDFALTRNRHGAGFWDGDWEHGDELTRAAKTFGSSNIVRCADGSLEIY